LAPEMKRDALRFVQRLNEFAEVVAHDALERKLLWCDYVNAESAGSQRGGDLESNKARPNHDRSFRVLRGGDDRSTVGQRTQIVNVRLVVARDVEMNWLSASGEEQGVVA